MRNSERAGHSLHLLAAAGVLRIKPYRDGFAVARPEGVGIDRQFHFVPRANAWRELTGELNGFGLPGMLRHLKVPMSQVYSALALQPIPEADPIECYDEDPLPPEPQALR